MLTIKTIAKSTAHIAIDVDGITYAWTVGDLAGVQDVPAHLEAHADDYREGVRTHLRMGLPVEAVTPLTLEETIAAKSSAIQAAKIAARDAGFDVAGTPFDSDAAARISYGELSDVLRADPTYTTPWRASPGAWVTMDAALYAQVQTAGAAHIQSVFAWQAARDAELAAIQAAVTAGTMSEADARAAVEAVSTTYEATS